VPERDESALAARDPARVLDYYAAALTAGDWQAAARVWAQQADMSAARLQAAYGAPPVRAMRFDAGTTEGAAGSLYHEARFALRREAADEWQHGSVVLRRVNDVPGASEEQLRWHIERSTPAP